MLACAVKAWSSRGSSTNAPLRVSSASEPGGSRRMELTIKGFATSASSAAARDRYFEEQLQRGREIRLVRIPNAPSSAGGG